MIQEIDSFLKSKKVNENTEITLALLIELLDGFAKQYHTTHSKDVEPESISDGWISVEDDSELIDGDQYIIELGFKKSNTCTICAYYENGKFYNLEDKEHEFKNVIFYQPLPKPRTPQKFPF